MTMPIGEPEAMRELARALRFRAETVATLGEQVQRRVDGLAYEGPAASRLRFDTERRRREAQRVAGELNEMAAAIVRSAAHVEEQTLALRRQMEEGSS